MEFIGRSQELAVLERQLRAVADGEARLVSVRGRRQVGKSRLVSEFVSRSGLPQFFVTGSRQASLAGDLESFRQDASLNCTLPGVDLLAGTTFATWEQALPGKLSRYRVADSYLRFWLRFVEAGISDIQRGRPDLAVARVTRDWPDYRGRAIEPLIREALARIAVDDPALGGAQAVGGWWPRSNNPEVDLVGVKPARFPTDVTFIGSIKWRETAPFDGRDLAALASDRRHVPGADSASLVAVARTACTSEPDAFYSAADLLRAWP